MSGMTGIFKFDPRDRVDPTDLGKLTIHLGRFGPDGGKEYIRGNVGMAYRAFHTTSESHRETQPLALGRCILTWDGRLDNRVQLQTELGCPIDDGMTDIDLVFSAYKQWDIQCFRKLLGDWALVLWDEDRQVLLLARDYIGTRSLFYRLGQSDVVWCTASEPIVLSASGPFHLDLNFIAGCLYPRPPLDASPYLEIRSVVPGTLLTISLGGKLAIERYWSLNPHAQIRYSCDEDYQLHFRGLLKESVRNRLRSDRTIMAESSGGIDSSSLVCVADQVRAEEPGSLIETLSYFDVEEPSGDERPYFSLIERKRSRVGTHISVADFTERTRGLAFSPLPRPHMTATPGLSTKSLEWNLLIRGVLESHDSRVILSGIGGDEFLGGIQYEAPELAEYLAAWRVGQFGKALLDWSLSRKKTVQSLVFEAVMLLVGKHHPASFLNHERRPFSWAYLGPPDHSDSLECFAAWRSLSPPQFAMELARYDLAVQIAGTGLPLSGCAEKRYPYLDRELFTFLTSIPRNQILRPNSRRHLMRGSLKGLVPDPILQRKSKWFGARGTLTTLRENQDVVRQMYREEWLSDGWLVDAPEMRKHLEAAEHGLCEAALPLQAAVGMELWLRSQRELGLIEIPPREPSPGRRRDMRTDIVSRSGKWISE